MLTLFSGWRHSFLWSHAKLILNAVFELLFLCPVTSARKKVDCKKTNPKKPQPNQKTPHFTEARILGRAISLPTILYISDKSKYVQITSDVHRKTTLTNTQRILIKNR